MKTVSRTSGQWCWFAFGFAMSVINEAEARDTLDALQNMFDVEPDVGALLYGEEIMRLLTSTVRRNGYAAH